MTTFATRTLLALAAAFALGAAPGAQGPIRTPFQVVSLWSEEMLRYVAGADQPACSGTQANACERSHAGVCDGSAAFTIGSPRDVPRVPRTEPARQTATGDPQLFRVGVRNAGSSGELYSLSAGRTIELVFKCGYQLGYGLGDECPLGQLHIGQVRRVEIGSPDGRVLFDLTRGASVHPEGRIIAPLDGAIRTALIEAEHPYYHVRAAAECFAVKPEPREWTLPVYDEPTTSADSPGAIVARAAPAQLIEFAYRPRGGAAELPFETDWTQHDWGYTYLREHTVLDRRGDWVQLPPRPFPRAVWVRLPTPTRGSHAGIAGLSVLEAGAIYELSKPVRARRNGDSATTLFPAGHVTVVGVRDRVLEFRPEEEFDSPCADRADRVKGTSLPTWLADAEEFYDTDLHLQLGLAYPKGC